MHSQRLDRQYERKPERSGAMNIRVPMLLISLGLCAVTGACLVHPTSRNPGKTSFQYIETDDRSVSKESFDYTYSRLQDSARNKTLPQNVALSVFLSILTEEQWRIACGPKGIGRDDVSDGQSVFLRRYITDSVGVDYLEANSEKSVGAVSLPEETVQRIRIRLSLVPCIVYRDDVNKGFGEIKLLDIDENTLIFLANYAERVKFRSKPKGERQRYQAPRLSDELENCVQWASKRLDKANPRRFLTFVPTGQYSPGDRLQKKIVANTPSSLPFYSPVPCSLDELTTTQQEFLKEEFKDSKPVDLTKLRMWFVLRPGVTCIIPYVGETDAVTNDFILPELQPPDTATVVRSVDEDHLEISL